MREAANDPRFWADVGPLVAFDYDQSRRIQKQLKQTKRSESIGGIFILSCLGIITGVIVGSVL